MPRQARTQRTERYAALSRGVRKRWLAKGTIRLGGIDYTPQEILDELQALVDAVKQSTQAHAAWRAQVAKQRALERAQRDFVRYVGVAVRLAFGRDLVALADFGVALPKKPGPKTVAAKRASAEKARATRAKRGTMGKRQRKKASGG